MRASSCTFARRARTGRRRVGRRERRALRARAVSRHLVSPATTGARVRRVGSTYLLPAPGRLGRARSRGAASGHSADGRSSAHETHHHGAFSLVRFRIRAARRPCRSIERERLQLRHGASVRELRPLPPARAERELAGRAEPCAAVLEPGVFHRRAVWPVAAAGGRRAPTRDRSAAREARAQAAPLVSLPAMRRRAVKLEALVAGSPPGRERLGCSSSGDLCLSDAGYE